MCSSLVTVTIKQKKKNYTNTFILFEQMKKNNNIQLPLIGAHETTYCTGQIYGGRVTFILFAQSALVACDNTLCNLHIIMLYNSHIRHKRYKNKIIQNIDEIVSCVCEFGVWPVVGGDYWLPASTLFIFKYHNI